tara:strand:- start:67 stop:342 length:276 start_codon:yes stop_codon:yes gene_type:complete
MFSTRSFVVARHCQSSVLFRVEKLRGCRCRCGWNAARMEGGRERKKERKKKRGEKGRWLLDIYRTATAFGLLPCARRPCLLLLLSAIGKYI